MLISDEDWNHLVSRITQIRFGDDNDWIEKYISDHKNRFIKDVEIIKNHLSTGKILDVGSLPPILPGLLKRDEGYVIAGVDINWARADLGAADLYLDEKIDCDIEREALPLNDCVFNAVIFNEVFEHLRIDPIFTMNEIYRVLCDGGILFLSTPNVFSVNGIYNILFRGRTGWCSQSVYAEFSKLQKYGHMGHVREYSVAEVTAFLEEIGFKVVRVYYRNDKDRGWVGQIAKLRKRNSMFFSLVAVKC